MAWCATYRLIWAQPPGDFPAAGSSSGSGTDSQCGHTAHVTVKTIDRTVLSAGVLTAPLGFVVVGQLEVAGTTRKDLLLRLEECFLFCLQS